jgi:hypothetical protein
MIAQDLRSFWQELKNLLGNAPESRKVKYQTLQRFNELKNKTSHFEKKSIKKDLLKINSEINSVINPSKES